MTTAHWLGVAISLAMTVGLTFWAGEPKKDSRKWFACHIFTSLSFLAISFPLHAQVLGIAGQAKGGSQATSSQIFTDNFFNAFAISSVGQVLLAGTIYVLLESFFKLRGEAKSVNFIQPPHD